MAMVNIVTELALAVMLVHGERRHDALRRSRLCLLAALAAGFVSALMPVVYQALVGHPPPRPWAGDAVALSYVPLTIAGLLLIPTAARRPGHRVRALADAFVAASSLWYLLLVIGIHVHRADSVPSGLAAAVRLAYPVGDVFVVAAAMAVVARVTPAARRMVGWMVLGISGIALNDVWLFLSGAEGTQQGPAMVFQIALLLLVGSATAPPVGVAPPPLANASPQTWWLGAVPFVPLLASMGMTTQMIVERRPIPAPLVLPALMVAIALTLRQLASSRDKERLIHGLEARELQLEAALRIDDLTGLANRRGLTERLAAALADRRQCPVTVVLFDLDEFKLINDNHGHGVGDDVLRELARRVTSALRSSDVVARMGGDEFAVVATTLDDAERDKLLHRLVQCFDAPVQVERRSFTVQASVGVVVGAPPETVGQLLAHADAAMYRSKSARAGRTTISVLDAAGRVDVARQLQLREHIARPDLAQFHVLYQPVVDLATGHIRGVEALLRWQHPDLGQVPPDAFIPLAEQAGSITMLGTFVLETAAADLARLRGRCPDRPLSVGVNVSPLQLASEAFAASALEVIARANVQPRDFTFEITEQAFEANLEQVAATVDQLAAAGAQIAVDDFGTGYSSLRYLQRLQLTMMKIDRSFVGEVTNNPASRQLVGSLAVMASSLRLGVVAEGIETLDHLRVLQRLNCELGQGYLFSRPATIDAIERLIVTSHVYDVGGDRTAPVMPQPRSPEHLNTNRI